MRSSRGHCAARLRGDAPAQSAPPQPGYLTAEADKLESFKQALFSFLAAPKSGILTALVDLAATYTFVLRLQKSLRGSSAVPQRAAKARVASRLEFLITARAIEAQTACTVKTLIEGRVVTVQHAAPDGMTVPLINELKRIGNNLNQMILVKIMRDVIGALVQNEVTRGRWSDAIRTVPSDAYNKSEFQIWEALQIVSKDLTPAPKAEPQQGAIGPAQQGGGAAIHVGKEEAPRPVAPAPPMPPQASDVGSKSEIGSQSSVGLDGYNPHGSPQGHEIEPGANEINTPPHPWVVPRLAEMKAQQTPPPRPSLLVRVARALGFKIRPPPLAEV
jgi:hypothetical protein